MNLKELLPEQHMGIFGGTGSGKSFTASKLHAAASQSVYFNVPDKEADDYSIKPRANPENHESPEGIITDIITKYDKVKWSCHWKDDEAEKELKYVYNQVKQVDGDIYLFVDEAHRFGDPLIYALRDGRGHNVHVIPITQRPKDLDTTAISQIQEFLVYRLSVQQRVWFKQMNMPFSDIKEWTDQDFHFIKWDNTEGSFSKFKPVPYP